MAATGIALKQVVTTLPATDLNRAKRFYSEKLGLSPAHEMSDGTAVYRCEDGSLFQVYPTHGSSDGSYTQAGFVVDDLDSIMADMRQRGVTFEEYDAPGLKTENGVATIGGVRGAWFKDSEGNLLGVVELGEPLL